ncbi:MAG: UvrD-helicase domain-containing protein, partial [Candidatus Latescibacteria bacterium]|nr:UvrD-helicase domain-containing protein [Candidatus Latescibacterota bacterium]
MPLTKLDNYQKNASTLTNSEIVVSAGAGSGKTRLLVGRYLHLVKSHSVPLSAIVAITFTDKAAGQMKAAIAERARELSVSNDNDSAFWKDIADNVHSAPISTIHAFCNSILRRYPLEAGIDPLFTILANTTLSSLTGEALETFMTRRMESEPEEIDFLLRTFGMPGLKRMYRILLRERARLITFLDRCGVEKPDVLESRYLQVIKVRL